MFKQWKENRQNKRDILLYQSFLLRTLAEFVLEFKQSQEAAKQTQEKAKQADITEEDALKILNSIKDLDQKEIASKLVDYIKSIKPKEKAE